jgi:hypothetical protein
MLADRIEVNYFTTQTPSLEEHGKCTVRDRKEKERLSEDSFLRTWCLNGDKGDPTTTPPSTKYVQMNHLWWGKIPMEAVANYILIRDVGLHATGRLDQTTLNLAAKLKLPHHVGAGGEEDFTDKEVFQKHVRRVSNRKKKKKKLIFNEIFVEVMTLLRLCDVELDRSQRRPFQNLAHRTVAAMSRSFWNIFQNRIEKIKPITKKIQN